MDTIPRLHFAHLPTPVEIRPRLTGLLVGPKLLIKRDDQTGLAFGGNKTRKLEFLLGEALSHQADMLITAGALQSNHCRQTAAAAAKFGMKCVLVLAGKAPPKASGNLLLDHLFDAQIVWTEKPHRDAVLQEVTLQAQEQGHRPYLVPYGGSNPTGALGYVYAMEELLSQGYQPDWIVFASSSGGTQAGLVQGAHLFGFAGQLLGISVDENAAVLKARVAALVTETSRKIGEEWIVKPDQVLVNADYCTSGYGVLTEAEREAIFLFARTEGILLDPVYTGRAAAGLIDLIRKGSFKRSETVLFWHTGGQPALFADPYRDPLELRP